MSRERVIRRLEEIAQANFCSLFVTCSTDGNPNVVNFIFEDNYSGRIYHMKINIEQISDTWSTAVERELAHRMEMDRVKDCKERLNSIYETMGLGRPVYVDHRVPKIKKVIFNNPATIIFWSDNTKTIVKAEHEPFDPEKGMAMAIAKKALGNRGKYYNEFKKWLPEEEEYNKTLIEKLTEAFKPLKDIKVPDITIPTLNIGVKNNGNND